MKIIISQAFQKFKSKIEVLIFNFDKNGQMLADGKRNKIKIFELDGKKINVKSFKIPNAINKFAYRFFRKSKAERSFYYAQHLISKGIGTPFPIGFAEETSTLAFLKSFYVSEQLSYDLTFREVDLAVKGHEELLKSFTRFIFELHEKKIQFLDNSPGNTLIQLNEGNPKFYLVDLNRMKFKSLNFEERMKNFSRLSRDKEIIKVMAKEYASHIDREEEEVFEKMWFFTSQFQKKFARKKRLKRRLKI